MNSEQIRAAAIDVETSVTAAVNLQINKAKTVEQLAARLQLLGMFLVEAAGHTIGARIFDGFLAEHDAASEAEQLHDMLTDAAALRRKRPQPDQVGRSSFDWDGFRREILAGKRVPKATPVTGPLPLQIVGMNLLGELDDHHAAIGWKIQPEAYRQLLLETLDVRVKPCNAKMQTFLGLPFEVDENAPCELILVTQRVV